MAESKNNVVTHGLSGKVGDMLVFSQRHGKTFVSRKPRVKEDRQPTPEQQQVQERFQQAVIYAKAAIADPTSKQAYEAAKAEGRTAFNIAVADLFNAPDIESIDLSGYNGNPGDKIIIRATDDFKMIEVKVTIANADGTEIESGNAVSDATNGLEWVYTATQSNASLSGDKLIVIASDMPGNLTQMQEVLS